MTPKYLSTTLFTILSAGFLCLNSTANAQITAPKNNPLNRPAPTKDIKPIMITNWEIVSAERIPASTARVKVGEQLKYRVTLRKNSARAKPVRIKVYPTKRDPNWKGWIDGMKFDIDTTRAGETVSQDILVRYSDRYALPPTSYGFQFVLESPDGTALNDHDKSDNTKKVRLLRKKKPKPKPKAKKKKKAKSSGVVRRSGVAGKTADISLQFKAPREKLLLHSIEEVIIQDNGRRCIYKTKFHQLGGIRPEESMESVNWCSLKDQNKVDANPSIISAEKAEYGVFGIRACSADKNWVEREIYDDSANVRGVQLWYKGISGNKLDDDRLRKNKLWNRGYCDWRPWQYCPKDSTGQRMVAVGFEAHYDNDTSRLNAGIGDLDGIRLICRPLADVWID